MKILYLDCGMGAAGDMLTAALLELLPDKQVFLDKLNALEIPGVEVKSEEVLRCGILGTRMLVTVNGMEEHEHCDNNIRSNVNHNAGSEINHHYHSHTARDEIHNIINSFGVCDKVKADACAVYDLIAGAESRAHGIPVGEVHFHEVGAMDALADVMAVCMLIRELAPDKIIASPVNTGFGSVRCAHGILPVPAPATASILIGVPVYAGQYEGEMCTPTGAALLKHFADEFGRMPAIAIENIGYGMGTKEFSQANCVRAILGYETNDTSGLGIGADTSNDELSDGHIKKTRDDIVELACNIDDMTGEELGYAAEICRDSGALDVFLVPVQMKKGRPGQMLVCLCRPENADELAECILRHTTTFGVRRTAHTRYILDRYVTAAETPFGSIRVKHGKGYGADKSKPEYEDLARAASEKCISLDRVKKSVFAAMDLDE